MSEDLVSRLRKRAQDDRDIQSNNEAVAQALAGQLAAFERRDGTHNNFAVRLGLDHASCAKKDAKLAADWDAAADEIERLRAENRLLRMMGGPSELRQFRILQEAAAALAREAGE